MRSLIAALVVGVVALTANDVHAQAPQTPGAAPVREITALRGNLYQAREGDQYTVFLVTPDGIILSDPLSSPFALWLKDEFAARFPGLQVRYVVYTHHHFDRAEGGGAFVTATQVAQYEYNRELSQDRRELPRFVGVQDRNDNGLFDPDELEGTPNAPLLLLKDRNHNGTVSADELYRQVVSARTTFGSHLTITLGGEQVTLVHAGAWHSPDMTVVVFPDERVAFAADPPPVTVVPFSFSAGRPSQVYDWLHAVAGLDVDTILLGDGRTLSEADVRATARYLDSLRIEVSAEYARGRSLEEMQATPLPEGYRGTPHYAGRLTQIASLYRTLTFRQFIVSSVGIANYGQLESGYCTTFTACTAGGAVGGITTGGAYMLNRRFGFAGEITLNRQSWSTRTRPLYGEEVAVRQSRGSFLVRVMASPSFAILAGLSTTHLDARGMNIVQGAVIPIGGRHDIHTHTDRNAVTAGIDLRLPIGSNVALVVPLRASYMLGKHLPAYWPGHLDASGGLGLNVRLMRRVRFR